MMGWKGSSNNAVPIPSYVVMVEKLDLSPAPEREECEMEVEEERKRDVEVYCNLTSLITHVISHVDDDR